MTVAAAAFVGPGLVIERTTGRFPFEVSDPIGLPAREVILDRETCDLLTLVYESRQPASRIVRHGALVALLVGIPMFDEEDDAHVGVVASFEAFADLEALLMRSGRRAASAPSPVAVAEAPAPVPVPDAPAVGTWYRVTWNGNPRPIDHGQGLWHLSSGEHYGRSPQGLWYTILPRCHARYTDVIDLPAGRGRTVETSDATPETDGVCDRCRTIAAGTRRPAH